MIHTIGILIGYNNPMRNMHKNMDVHYILRSALYMTNTIFVGFLVIDILIDVRWYLLVVLICVESFFFLNRNSC